MKKIILIFIVFMFFPLTAKTIDTDDDSNLIYDVESVKITKDTITFKGWSFVDKTHSIGGQNYKVTIYAVDSNEINSYDSKGIKVENKVARGGNRLYPSTCFKKNGKYDGVRDPNGAGTCEQVHYGYVSGTGTIDDGRGYATCTSDQTSCMNYNPEFEIKFDIDDLQDEFGYEQFTFVIQIDYTEYTGDLTASSACKYENGSYNGCVLNEDAKITLSRLLLFDESVVQKNSSLINNVSTKFDVNFKINTGVGRLRKPDGMNPGYVEFAATAGTYFVQNGEYTIVSSLMRKDRGGAGTGIEENLRLYELKTASYVSNTEGYIAPGVEKTAWAWSTWGTIDGSVIFQFYDTPDRPSPGCGRPIGKDECMESSFNISCDEIFMYTVSNDELRESGINLNKDGCGGDAFYRIEKVFNFVENNTLSKLKGFTAPVGVGRGFEIMYRFTRNITFSDNEIGTYYYYVSYNYWDDDLERCTNEDGSGYITKSELETDFGITVNENFLKSYFSDEVSKIWNNTNSNYKQDHGLNCRYPSSNTFARKNPINTACEYYTLPDVTYFVRDSHSSTYTVSYDFILKSPYINKFNGKIQYDSPSVNSNYIRGGSNYYIPFDALEYAGKTYPDDFDNPFYFVTRIENNSIFSGDKSLTSMCYVNLFAENYKYRVINLNDPFPNNEPEENGRASNWYNLWSSNKDILINRYNEKGVLYNVNLTQDNIKSIRDYNDRLYNNEDFNEKYLYINANIDNNGDSSFIDRYLKDNIGKDVMHSKPGERGVE